MNIRKIVSTLFAALLVSASFAAAASAATTHHPAHHGRAAMHHSAMKGHPAMRHDGGDAAVDALNQQSLAAARNGTTPSVTGSTPQ